MCVCRWIFKSFLQKQIAKRYSKVILLKEYQPAD